MAAEDMEPNNKPREVEVDAYEGDSEASNAQSVFYLLVTVALVGVFLFGIYFLVVNRESAFRFLREAGYQEFAVATIPEGATIVIDGQVVGRSPILKTVSPGRHTVSARLDGYFSESLAVDLRAGYYSGPPQARVLVDATPWVANFRLKPLPATRVNAGNNASSSNEQIKVSVASATSASVKKIESLQQQIRDVRSLIAANPEEAISFGMLKGRVENLSDQVESMRDDIKTANDLRYFLIGLFVTAFLFIIERMRGNRHGGKS